MSEVASVVFAAGKGSRMVGYGNNKTLLPLKPGLRPYEGERPLLLEVLENLPPGPKGIVVNHCADDVRGATAHIAEVSYSFQPVTNGTGGALLAARPFLENITTDRVIITMGDVPLIQPATYLRLVSQLELHALSVLVFVPRDRAQYGMVRMAGSRPVDIVEWKYWSQWGLEEQESLRFCNAGVYAARKDLLLTYLDRLQAQPHHVEKARNGQMVTIEEYFLTDLVEWMSGDGLPVSVLEADEHEVMGIDTPEALQAAQKIYAERG